jgi:hypothetical protein
MYMDMDMDGLGPDRGFGGRIHVLSATRWPGGDMRDGKPAASWRRSGGGLEEVQRSISIRQTQFWPRLREDDLDFDQEIDHEE